MSSIGRLMGIDHGEKRIGIALSDPLRIISKPHSIIELPSAAKQAAAIRQIAQDEGVIKFVVGLATDAQGRVGVQAESAVRWARVLAETSTIPVVFWDESYSSMRAAELVRTNRKKKGGQQAAPLDDLAAASFLQEYLDAAAGGNDEDEPGQPLAAFADIV